MSRHLIMVKNQKFQKIPKIAYENTFPKTSASSIPEISTPPEPACKDIFVAPELLPMVMVLAAAPVPILIELATSFFIDVGSNPIRILLFDLR